MLSESSNISPDLKATSSKHRSYAALAALRMGSNSPRFGPTVSLFPSRSTPRQQRRFSKRLALPRDHSSCFRGERFPPIGSKTPDAKTGRIPLNFDYRKRLLDKERDEEDARRDKRMGWLRRQMEKCYGVVITKRESRFMTEEQRKKTEFDRRETAALMIQRCFKGFIARERYKAKKVMKDIDTFHAKYSKIRTTILQEKAKVIWKAWKLCKKRRILKKEKERIPAPLQTVKIEEKSAIKSNVQRQKKTIVRPGIERPSALKITPSWKVKIIPAETKSAVFGPNSYKSSNSKSSDSDLRPNQLMRRKLSMNDSKKNDGIRSQRKRKKTEPPQSLINTEPSTPNSPYAEAAIGKKDPIPHVELAKIEENGSFHSLESQHE